MPGKDVGTADTFAASDGGEVKIEVLEDSRTRAKEEVEAGTRQGGSVSRQQSHVA